MSQTLKENRLIGVDLMGGDNAPESNIEACLAAAQDGFHLAAFGTEEAVDALESRAGGLSIITVVCSEVVVPDEPPLQAIRRKPDSSIRRGITAVKEGAVDAFVSAGSTGALVAGGALILGRAGGVDKPCLAQVLPDRLQRGVLFLDLGASTDSRPQTLVQFAVMGSAYAEGVLGRENPKVFLLNNGTEPEKGNAVTKKAFELLKSAPVNFMGNIEARDVFSGIADVIVSDGFSGNVFLKTCEGTSEFLMSVLREEITRGLMQKAASLILKPAFSRVRALLDYSNYGGAPLLGLRGCVVKCHGSSGHIAVANGIRQAHRYIVGKVSDVIERTLAALNLEGE
ncbi:MAG TPA: phosphate acyltransferase PlsX [Firmicutes bacterium]|nr:phosphate acyltransferase PlsX [Candidatus Fermentithermobacillaceae bacterium]